ncbi:uncharacterized protein TrAtP1_004557 [Trichoderma atroviride]|uniref:uncharacterized protein n=1 Tax=Hypocrea atroviridis TaxID=63577 RepID=UPI00332AB5D1|nr:hypothetical protein TrAtP1_004557 [Trichoderma atroviride]
MLPAVMDLASPQRAPVRTRDDCREDSCSPVDLSRPRPWSHSKHEEIVAAAFPAGEERRGGSESDCGLGLVQWKRNSVNQVREESQHHEPKNAGAGASAGSGSHARAAPSATACAHSATPKAASTTLTASSSSLQLPLQQSNGTLILAMLGSAHLSSVLASGISYSMLGERRLPNLFPPPTSSLRRTWLDEPFPAIAPQANRCEALGSRIAWTTARPGLLHERPLKMKRAWSNASEWPPVERRRC